MRAVLKGSVFCLLAATLALSGCKTGGSNKDAKKAQSVEDLLNSDGAGKWTAIKATSRIKGYSVFLSPDGKYYAFNADGLKKGMTKDEFIASATVYSGLARSVDTYQQYGQVGSSYYTSYYCPYSYGGDTSISCSANGYDLYGNVTSYSVSEVDYGYTQVSEDIYVDSASGLVFELGDTTSKDLESVSAALEASNTSTMSAALVAGYGLSENRATEIASLAKSWQNIEKSRSMTAKDLVQFQSKVFGSDLGSLQKAYVKASNGDSKDYDTLIQKAARLNDISPEQAKAIFKDFAN